MSIPFKLYSFLFFLAIFFSCSNDEKIKKEKTTLAKPSMDSISKVDIMYFPAFTNSSILHLDRNTGVGTFTVDTMIEFNYGIPIKDFLFSVADMENNTLVNRFWNEQFIRSLQVDTTKPPSTDGMSVWVFYGNSRQNDSVYLGNNHPPHIDSILFEQLDYLNTRTKDKALKAYIKQVKEYL